MSSTRTVRFGEEDERQLLFVCDSMDMSVSDALKYGLAVAGNELRAKAGPTPWEVYEAIDLGQGGHAKASARKAKQAVRAIIARKHQR